MALTIVLGAVAAALTAAHPPDAASRELLRSLAIVSVDSRDLSSSIQYLVRYAGSKPAETAAPLTLAQYPLAAAMSAWTKAVYCERHGCQFRLFWASPNASAFKPWFKSRENKKKAPPLNSAWLKPLTIHHVLTTTSFEFVLFLDGDALFTRFDVSLAPLLRDMRAQQRNIALGLPNSQGHNAGVILVRRSPETLAFVREWWETHAHTNWSHYSSRPFFEQTTLNFAMLAQKRYMSTLCETDLLTSGELNHTLALIQQGADLTVGKAGDKKMDHAWRATNRQYAKRCMYGVDPNIGPILDHLSTGKTKTRVRKDHAMASLAAQPHRTPKKVEESVLLQSSVRTGTQTVLVLEKMMQSMIKSDWLVSDAAAAEDVAPLDWLADTAHQPSPTPATRPSEKVSAGWIGRVWG